MKKLCIKLIEFYQYAVSPLFPASCRFVPSCSAYSIEALDRYGVCKGAYMTVRRILRCNPFHPGGFDPVL